MTTETVLVIGYGNPGRLDDGLGPACAEAIEKLKIEGVSVDSDYQLTVEDAEQIARHDVVVFADASVSGAEPFDFTQVNPCGDVSFSTHSVEPEAVLAMAHDMFGSCTRGFALAIRGYEFNDFGEGLSTRAETNLKKAVDFIAGVIRDNSFERYEIKNDTHRGTIPRVTLDITSADMN